MTNKVWRLLALVIAALAGASVGRAQASANKTKPEDCDKEVSREKAEWAKTEHTWVESELHVQRVEEKQTWCRIKATHKGERFHSWEDFGRVLLTGEGIHPVAGSIVPNSGFAGGLSLNLDYAARDSQVRFSESMEARGSANGFWVAGGSLNLLGSGKRTDNRHNDVTISAAHRSLPQLPFFGIGNASALANQTLFGLTDTVLKINGAHPLPKGFQLLGVAEGLWASPQGFQGSTIPSIEKVFTPTNTPGLQVSTGYFVYGAGIYWEHPVDECMECWWKTDFSATIREFHEATGLPYSFRRLDIVWRQDFDLDFGSNVDLGTLSLTGRLKESVATGGNQVPFYLQPTFGGTDIENIDVLRSYRDYRFRAPHLLAFQAEYTRAIRDPLGVLLFYDVGKVAAARGDLDFTHMKHSFGAGFTLRVGNLPWFKLYYAWAGPEGSHTTYTGNTNNFTLDSDLRGVF